MTRFDSPEHTSVQEPTFDLTFPPRAHAALDQDEEWCEVTIDGSRRRIRFHDYHEIYPIPGLYEHLFYDRLECSSPPTVRTLFEEEMAKAGKQPAGLRVLDVGAGNGMMGAELADMGVPTLVGVDIIAEAAAAAERDRPGLYDDYMVADLTDLSAEDRGRLAEIRFNCLVTVAALGFGDMPPTAFAEAYNSLETPSWVAFNIKEDFLEGDDRGDFSGLIARMLEKGALEERARRRYRHRLSASGEPLHYLAMVAVKRADIPLESVQRLG